MFCFFWAHKKQRPEFWKLLVSVFIFQLSLPFRSSFITLLHKSPEYPRCLFSGDLLQCFRFSWHPLSSGKNALWLLPRPIILLEFPAVYSATVPPAPAFLWKIPLRFSFPWKYCCRSSGIFQRLLLHYISQRKGTGSRLPRREAHYKRH